jgi:sugar lactone lactonase YvrE
LAIDPSNQEVYVGGYDTNTYSQHVFEFDPSTGNLDSSFGSGGQIDGSTTPNHSFFYPAGLATDPSNGDLYVADLYAGAVYKFDSSGAPVNSFGDAEPVNGSLHGEFTPAENFGPTSVAVDPSSGDLYVADSNNSVVDIFASNGSYISQFSTAASGLYGPSGVAVDSAGNVYVAGSGQTQKFNPSGNPLPVDGTPGDTNVLDSQGSNAVAIDPADDDVYVDEGAQISQFDNGGNLIATFGAGKLSYSPGLAVPSGAARVYASDQNDSLIHVFGALTPRAVLTTSQQGSGSITCDSGSGPGPCAPYYAQGTTITLAANPEAHFSFGGWEGACSGSGSCEISNISADTTVSANFVQIEHTVSVSLGGAGSGSVSADSGSISGCVTGGGGTCSGSYNEGGTVVLRATRTGHSAFTGWSGDCTNSSGPCVLSGLPTDASVTANFTSLPSTYVTYTTGPTFSAGSPPPYGASDVAVEQLTGDIYVSNKNADSEYNGGSIVKLDPSGNVLNSWEKGAAMEGVAFDPDQELVYGLSERGLEGGGVRIEISHYDENGIPYGFPITLTEKRFVSYPLRTDANGNIYFPDRNKTVTKFDAQTGVASIVLRCSDCPGLQSFARAYSVAVAPDGSIYVGDAGDPNSSVPARVVKFHSDGSFDSVLTEFASQEPTAMSVAVDPSTGDVLVGSGAGHPSFHIVEYDELGQKIADFAQNQVQGYNNEGLLAPQNQVAVSALSGTVYVNDADNGGFVHTFTPDPYLQASTEGSDHLSPTGATIKGVVDPGGNSTVDCHFEYGPTAAYGQSVPCSPSPGSATIRTGVSAALTGLTGSTDYHYKVVEQSSGGTVSGTDETLTTPSQAPPTVTTGQASAVSQTGAHVNGVVSPNGSDTTCVFEYGTSTAYGSTAPCPASVSSGESGVTVGIGISGLAPGTTYHFRLSATNGGGTSSGEDATFQTLADTCETNAALCKKEGGGGGGEGKEEEHHKPLHCRKGFKKKKVHGTIKCVKVKHHRHRGKHHKTHQSGGA